MDNPQSLAILVNVENETSEILIIGTFNLQPTFDNVC